MSNQLKPGPKLDALVAEKVMGWKTNHWGDWSDDVKVIHYRGDKDWSPSTSIADAWEVVEKLKSDFYVTMSAWEGMNDDGPDYRVQISAKENGRCSNCKQSVSKDWEVWRDTAPHALCLAALKAVGYLN